MRTNQKLIILAAAAARLVEVVCRQERTRLIHVETIHALSDDADVLRAERDAARAEVAALREEEWAAPKSAATCWPTCGVRYADVRALFKEAGR